MSPTNEHGQPVGEPLDWEVAPQPVPVELTGRYVTVSGLEHEHAPELFAVDLPAGRRRAVDLPAGRAAANASAMESFVAGLLAHPSDVTFAISPRGRGPEGIATLMRVDPDNGVVEVGGILLARSLQRTPASTEAMYLLAHHVFDALGYRRYEWKCDSLNEPSRGRGRAAGLHLRGPVPQRRRLQGPQPRHRLVLDHRRRVAAGPGRPRGLAGPGQLRRVRSPAHVAVGPDPGVTRRAVPR